MRRFHDTPSRFALAAACGVASAALMASAAFACSTGAAAKAPCVPLTDEVELCAPLSDPAPTRSSEEFLEFEWPAKGGFEHRIVVYPGITTGEYEEPPISQLWAQAANHQGVDFDSAKILISSEDMKPGCEATLLGYQYQDGGVVTRFGSVLESETTTVQFYTIIRAPLNPNVVAAQHAAAAAAIKLVK